jgi:cytochrome c biogenesis protein CcmG/thiol:disulfide interchange protein DsbE
MAMKAPRLVAATALSLAFLMLPSGLSGEVLKSRYRRPAPGFTLVDGKRAPITLSDYKGKVVLLDFWATWCAGCKVEMPWFSRFDTKYRNNGLVVIGVSMDEEGWAIVTPYLEAHPISYTAVLGDLDVSDRYGVASLPVTLLIDRNGKVAAKHFGVVDGAGFENEIKKLLKERPKKTK